MAYKSPSLRRACREMVVGMGSRPCAVALAAGGGCVCVLGGSGEGTDHQPQGQLPEGRIRATVPQALPKLRTPPKSHGKMEVFTVSPLGS